MNIQSNYSLSWRKRVIQMLLAGAGFTALVFAAACGGGSSSGGGGNPPPPATSKTQVRIGDAPVDRVIAFEVTMGSPITLTPSTGSNVTVTVGANRLELSHTAGNTEPLSVVNAPQGTYTSATIVIKNPEVVYLDNAGVKHQFPSSTVADQTVTVNFSPALTIGATAQVLSIDLNVANSLTFDGSGAVTGFNFSGASFTFGAKAVAGEAEQEDDSGELEDVTGLVTAATANSFTMTVGQSGASLTFNTDANTQFSDGITDAQSTLNQIVKVEGATQVDGSLLAKEVEGIENQNGAEVEGIISAVTGNPASSLTILAQDGIGSGMDGTKVGTSFTVDVSGASYKVSKGHVDLGGTNLAFDAVTVHAGQRVEVESTGSVASGSITADKVKLQQQALTGTVTATASGSFTMTIPADAAFAILSGGGTPSVNVIVPTRADNRFGTIAVGKTVRVRGLVFNSAGTFTMVARRITTP